MKKSLLSLSILSTLFTLLSVPLLSSAHAGEAKMAWADLSKFSDIQEGQESKTYFQERVVKEFGEIFNRYADRYLPEGYTLEITVDDIDLAGDVRPMMVRGGSMRVLTRIYWPKMSFDYVLKDPQNNVLKTDKVSLKDMNFLERNRISSGKTIFEHEDTMIEDWFKQQQRDQVFPKKETR